MNRTHDSKCRCAPCRHKRFNPGPPSLRPKFSTIWGHPRPGKKRNVERAKNGTTTPGAF